MRTDVKIGIVFGLIVTGVAVAYFAWPKAEPPKMAAVPSPAKPARHVPLVAPTTAPSTEPSSDAGLALTSRRDLLTAATSEPATRPAVPAFTSLVAPAAPREYTVKSGDTFWSIATHELGGAKHVADLQKANPGVTTLHKDQKLKLPVVGGTSPAGSTGTLVSSLSGRPTTMPVGLGSSTLSGSLGSGTAGTIGTSSTYTVASGDTLWTIAQKNGITLKALNEANPGVSADLHPGQTLKLPARAGGSATVALTPPAATTRPVGTSVAHSGGSDMGSGSAGSGRPFFRGGVAH